MCTCMRVHAHARTHTHTHCKTGFVYFTAAAVPGIADELTLSGDDESSAQEAFDDQPHPTAA